MGSEYFEDPVTEMESFQLEQEAESAPDPERLVEKIGKLQTVLLELVSRPGSTAQQHTDIEKLVDQLMSDANRMFVEGSYEAQSELSHPVSGFKCNEVGNCSPGRTTTVFTSSSPEFSLDCLDFHVPAELRLEPLEHPAALKKEFSAGNEDFMSFLVYDPEQEQDQRDGTSGVKAELDEEGDHDVLPPGSYDLIELDAVEILAEHTHFCELCGKGFKRDANLRMHMRGHGDEYKSAAALSKPKDPAQEQQADQQQQQQRGSRMKRYSCPFAGCKRHKTHPKFAPLKTVLCVKNHYRRSHCPKMLTCSRCRSKKFSVMADLRTHEKHCGREKWSCSCGTTFSRKDKLMGHISLFVGHQPLAPGSSFRSDAEFYPDQKLWSQVVFPSELLFDRNVK